tara:strand:+ start:118 stop:447 length:330 start_codon:yes stop_codon:yes gene_type:complete
MKNTIDGKKYANMHLYTDINPYEIIEVRTPNKIIVRLMDAEKDPSVKLKFHPGGFCGHVSNQDEQKWFYKSNKDNPVVTIWKRKDGHFYDGHLRFVLSDEPIMHYDYNF